jgi:hypothetical protein
MNVGKLVKDIGCKVVTGTALEREVKGCYVSDLLSDVLAGSESGQLWVTQHTHPNVVAVAAVKSLSAILVVGSKEVAEDTAERAASENVNIIATELTAFEAVGRIYTLLGKEGTG